MPIERITGVLVCGNISLDMPVWPVESFQWGTTAWVQSIGESVGGNGANTSYSLGTLGVPVRLIGAVGSDDAGEKMIRMLAATGVDTSSIVRSDRPSTITIALVRASGDRQFLNRPGASADVDPTGAFEELAGVSHFHLANPFTMWRVRQMAGSLFEQAKAAGLTTSLDLGWDPLGLWMQIVGPCLPFADLLFLNDTETKMVSASDAPDDAVAFLRAHGAKDVVVKTGPGGCLVYRGDERIAVPGFVVEAIDTTGAGDCFSGAFLAALAREWSYEKAARFANAVGACNVQKLGAAQGVLPFEATLKWMAERDKL